jgi:type IV pilus assembly protein PilY1
VITNPSVDATGIVYFTTFKPQNDPCYKGGQTNIWAVKFDTGGSATGLIQGTAIIQVSTGSIEQVNLATAFTERDNRRTGGMTGQPPTREGLTVIPGAPGVSKPLFMKERL